MASASLMMQGTTNSSGQQQIPGRPQQDLPPTPTSTPTSAPTPTQSPWARGIRQFGLLAAGAGFMAASIAVSRRAVLRRRLDTIPKFYTPNRDGGVKFDSSDRSLMAVQALGLATLNVMSFGIMLVGGISWAFDVSNLAELRARSQAALRKPGIVNPEDEEQMEEMLSDLLGRLGMDPAQKGEGLKKGDELPATGDEVGVTGPVAHEAKKGR